MSVAGTVSDGAAGHGEDVVRFEDFSFDRDRRALIRDGDEVDLPPRALGVLELLLARPGRLARREELEQALWDEAPATPRSLNEAVMQLRRGLDDDPRQPRYVQTVHRRGYRFIAAVEEGAPAGSGEPAVPGLGPTAALWSALGAAMVVGMIIGAVLVPLVGRAGETGLDPALHVRLALDAPLVPEPDGESALAVSADGTRLVYVARTASGDRQLRVLELGGRRSRVVEGTRGRPRSPFLSPDGSWIAYFADGFLWRVAVSGGEPTTVARVADTRRVAGTWTDADRLVFSEGRGRGLAIVPAHGGVPVELTAPGGGGRSHLSPQAVPGTHLVVYVVEPRGSAAFSESRIDWIDVGTGAGGTLVAEGGGRPRVSRSGLLVFARDGALAGLPLDLSIPRPLAPARTLVPDVMMERRAAAQYDLAADGTLVHATAPRVGLRWHDRLGGSDALAGVVDPPRRFALAPDGARVALERAGDLSVVDLGRGGAESFLGYPADETHAVWSPDGQMLYFSSNRRGPYDIYRVRPGGPAEPVINGRFDQRAETLTPDGETLVFSEFRPGSGNDLWRVSVGDAGTAAPVLRTPFHERQASLSPDGRWLAYVTDEGGADRVVIRPWSGAEPVLRIPRAGARMPRWSASGDELFFIWLNTLWAVSWPDDPAAGLPSPVPAFLPGAPVSQYAPTADGRRFLVAFGPQVDVVRLQYLEDWGEAALGRFAVTP